MNHVKQFKIMDMKKINQKHYPKIEVDTREKDIVQLWQNGDVIQIELENIKTIIDLLISESN